MSSRDTQFTRLRTVLLVEDHASYRSVVHDALTRYLANVEVLTAGSVAEALDALRSHDVNVLVADMTLPDGTAIDLLDGAAALDRGNCKAILLSNHSSVDMLPVLTRPDVHGYVSKEQGVKALAAAICANLDGVIEEPKEMTRSERNP
ncbi:response regulator [Prosthecobacter sp.]|uniref:response regulator n=1 Tax=Prosthecobacter sp. TaxID=1965333 RepID=UPI001D724DD2|nr:response regulator [Prosthecobacter sp.]MCB1278015.1 response regulator [Prosthecobacter sp.]